MAGFTNDELQRIRKNLICNHCKSVFEGSDSQARKVKYEKRNVYCSTTCRNSDRRAKFAKPLPYNGECKQCGVGFSSKKSKIFCSMDCYIKSDDFKKNIRKGNELSKSKEVREKIAAKLRKGVFTECLECGSEIWSKPSRHRKFCSTVCYRAYLAKRFDRFVANKEKMGLPQCYDEFLDQEVLHCLIDGCDWEGIHLTAHINLCHGIKANEFKRAAGFNYSTGVISKVLAKQLQGRELQGVAKNSIPYENRKIKNKKIKRYRSKECDEHFKKSRALLEEIIGPTRICRNCGMEFTQKRVCGRRLYCNNSCRTEFYKKKNK